MTTVLNVQLHDLNVNLIQALKQQLGKNAAVEIRLVQPIVEEKLLKFVPNDFKLDAHHWLILHGRYTCIARTPKCWNCMIADLCEFKQKTPLPDNV